MAGEKETSLISKYNQLEKELALNVLDLDRKNRELEIEKALEKVRVCALDMRQPDDMLDICCVMCGQLELLGITDIRNVQTAIIYTDKGIYINYEYYRLYKKTFVTEVDYSHPIQADFVEKMLTPGAHLHVSLEGKELKDWFEYQKSTNQFSDPHLAEVSSLHYYWFSIGPVALGISLYAPLSTDGIELFKGFLDVFRLAYQRYKDVELALGQAKEARIEVALERVRSKAMAMHSSEDLAQTVNAFFKELKALGITPIRCGVGQIDEATRTTSLTTTTSFRQGDSFDVIGKLKQTGHPVLDGIYDHWVLQEEYHPVLKGPDIKAYYDVTKSQIAYPDYSEDVTQYGNNFFFKEGFVFAWTEKELSEDELKIFRRFTSVLSLTYRRYIDLKEAEAQAREARIEAAIEKVRSRSLAMHHTEELQEVITVVFNKLQELDMVMDVVNISIPAKDTKGVDFWIAVPDKLYSTSIYVPYFDTPVITDFWAAQESGPGFFAKAYTFEEKTAYWTWAFEHSGFKHLSEQRKTWILEGTGFAVSAAFERNTAIVISSHSGQMLSEKEKDILTRFARVFEQAYTRFLDLEKAEAQARESQIQLALERIRARTMAMQKSDELLETSQVVFHQLRDLGETADQISIAIVKEDEGVFDFFATVYGNQMVRMFKISLDEPFTMGKVYKSWKANKKSFAVEIAGEELREYNKVRNAMSYNNYYNEDIGAEDRWIINAASFSQGVLSFSSSKEPTIGATQLLERFAKVFESTYTRFLDLQKAEAQAKESKIEAALERVRSRSMAMQKSHELKEVIQVVYDQFVHLDIQVEHTGFIVDYKEQDNMHIWLADPLAIPFEVTIPYFDSAHFNSFNEAKEKGTDFFANKLSFEEKNRFYQDLFERIPGIAEETKDYYFNCPGLAISTVLLDSVGLYIENFAGTPYSDEENKTLMRFGKVFQQTYRRFLDLQQAEAQAREAQIQLALERVRAKTMAMQKSDELTETSYVLFQQFKELGANAEQISIGIFNEEEGIVEVSGTLRGIQFPQTFTASIDEPFVMGKIYKDWKSGKKSTVIEMAGQELHNYNKYRNKLSGLQFNINEDSHTDRYVINCVFFSKGVLSCAASDNVPKQTLSLLERFAAVFDGTYTRFLDLKQAEAQAKESQIQLALERVRARTMAMQKSEELAIVIQAIYDQLVYLGLDVVSAGFVMDYKQTVDLNLWTANHGQSNAYQVHIPYYDGPIFNLFNEAKAKDIDFYPVKLNKEEKDIHYRHVFQHTPPVPDELKEYVYAMPGYADSHVLMKDVVLFISNLTGIPYSNAENAILMRFGKVFEQTYTRFKDLKHAEEQAQEARIEAALERVRSKTMAMHNSADIGDTVSVMFEQLVNLGVKTTVRCGVAILYDAKHMEVWTASSDTDNKVSLIIGRLEMTIHPMLEKMHEAWQNKEASFSYELKGEDIKDYYRAVIASPEYHFQHALESMPARQINNVFFFAEGALFAFTTEPFSPEATQLFKRFAGVFGLTYRRFLDLQKAEAQAREAQIEASLERVRSRTMAMHNSRDVGETVAAMFDECIKLGVDKSVRCGIGIIRKTKEMEVWTAYTDADAKIEFIIGRLDMTVHQMLEGVFNSWQNKAVHSSYLLTGEDQKDYYRAINSSHDYNAHFKLGSLPVQQFQNAFYFPEGFIYVFSHEQLTADALAIFKRFAGIFGLTYRRFLDLQKAETQAREAQIEVALERVRSRTMAMQASDELAETSVELFKQLIGLGIAPNRLFIGIIKDDSGDIELWATDEDGMKISTRFAGNMNGNASVKKMYQGWKEQKKSITIDMRGKELKDYFHYLSVDLKVPFKLGLSQKRRVQLIAYFSQGFIGIASPDIQPAETNTLLERFAGVFNLTYTRFNDLQKAEAQAHEAVKQASIDRVRAEIASMRTTKDLEKITPLVWDELTTLGVPFIRCGVFIVDESEELVYYYLSTPDGKALAAFRLPFDAEGIGRNVLQNWRQKQVFKIHWSEAEFTEYTKSLVRQGAVNSGESYVTAHPPTSLDLHFFPFLQGMLYVGNIVSLNHDEMLLVQSLADAFSTAYARYEDFNKLEEAKQEVEKTLTELKAAQTKLIQSEKMASLGELTAGIAHEIQNPLNFVNNFSEVNQEMIDELEDELRAGNIEEALAIAADVKQNEEKINHHGKRADGIVKGMLQHSRTSSGEKQLTNINVLADKFMRLSYHGLRAKDKSFNSEMVTDFDPELPKINVIAQDIGRVLLNLFNNAFYAVSEKRKTADTNYKAKVTATTSSENGQLLIKVLDNGNGIPDAIKDKIMQPFFTTKPTGEGTGLGLSLSYDIVVKGHGGSITVNTKEGEFTEFVVSLPLKLIISAFNL